MLRMLDVVFSAAMLAILSPLILILFVMVRPFSSGPIIFAQPRVGKEKRIFTCYKLRTMRLGTPEGPSHEVGMDTVTPVGRFLRQTKMDEIPQLWNVLLGDMSLVGPRPCLPTQEKLIFERSRRGVYEVRPGITGPAQVAGVDMSDPERLAELDAEWVRSKSALIYLRLLFFTVMGRGRGDAASSAPYAPGVSERVESDRDS